MRLEGHINHYHDKLGLATTPDDNFVFAAGSDGLVRAWSLLTGTRIEPPSALDINGHPLLDSYPARMNHSNPLLRWFVTSADRPPSVLAVRDDGGLDVAAGGAIHRFGRKEHTPHPHVEGILSHPV